MDGSMLMIDPFRSPRWRCDRVMHLLRFRLQPRRRDTYPIRAYQRYLLTCIAAGDNEVKLEEAYRYLPHVAQVHRLHYSPDTETEQILQARLLTSEKFEEIAGRMGTEAQVIELYEQLFFDVRGRMQASIVINKIILGPPSARAALKGGGLTEAQRGFLYRLFAFYGGPMVLDSLITGIGNVKMPQRPDDVSEWFDNSLRQIMQIRAVAAARIFEINKKNVIPLMKLAISIGSKGATGRVAQQTELNERHLAKVLGEINGMQAGSEPAGTMAHAR